MRIRGRHMVAVATLALASVATPFVDSDDVNVAVLDGIATLTGVLDSWSEKWEAREQAYEGGAISVRNRFSCARRRVSRVLRAREAPQSTPASGLHRECAVVGPRARARSWTSGTSGL